jgi:FtsH-binding integral membrane protein
MKILKGFLVTVITLIALIIVNMICNVNGINLNTIISGTTTAIVAMFIYEAITKKDRNKK